MSAVTKQEIVEALRQAYDCSVLPFFGPLADRIEQHGIAPPDGWALVPKEPVLWVRAEDLYNPYFIGINAVREGYELHRKHYDTPLYAAAP